MFVGGGGLNMGKTQIFIFKKNPKIRVDRADCLLSTGGYLPLPMGGV